MKKLIATVAVLACAASVVSAQTVTSQNIVGYNKDVSAIGFHISGMQFDNAVANTPTTVYGDSLPLNSKIYTWNGSGYVIVTYGQSFVPFVGLVTKWNNETLPISVGEGFWYETATPQTWIATKPFSE